MTLKYSTVVHFASEIALREQVIRCAEEATQRLELDVEDEGVTGDVDVDAATSALQDLGSALGLDLEIVDEEGEGGEEEFDVDMEDGEEGGEEELDVDLEEMAFGRFGEGDDKDLDETDDADLDEGDVYEIDETVLRRELTKMRKQRKVRESRRPSRGRQSIRRAVREAAEDEADQFGGAEILGDVIEVDEDTLINVLADELGSVSTSGVAESRRRRAGRRPATSGVNRRS